MLITLEEYKQIFRNQFQFWFRDCVVRSKDIFVFILEPSLTDEQVEEEERLGYASNLRPKGVSTFVRNHPDFPPGNQWFADYFAGWEAITLGAAEKPLNQSVSVERVSVFPSMDHRCYVTGSGPAYEDTSIIGWHKPGPSSWIRGAVTRLKPIDGWLYGCGGGRAFAKRLDRGTWQSFTADIPELEGTYSETLGREGFADFDAFAEDDIYAVGGHGDVWHYDGRQWRQLPFPTNEILNAVCCGGDGNVYISGYGGLTFMGRGARWKKIHNGGLSLAFRDMVWYEGKVWCTNDYGLWTIENGRLRMADVPATVSVCAGHLSVGDGVLLLAGLSGAVFRENGAWHQIVQFSTMSKLLTLEEAEGKE